jgi:hypothetical protein
MLNFVHHVLLGWIDFSYINITKKILGSYFNHFLIFISKLGLSSEIKQDS